MEIGMVGLGNAGKPIAERLLNKSHRLKVYDLNAAPINELARLGAAKAHRARDVAGEITLVVLPSSIEARAAVYGDDGLLAGAPAESVLLDLSGTDPYFARELERDCDKRNVHFVGGTLHAAGAPAVTIPKGLVSVVVGGRRSAVEKCLGILTDLCRKVICVEEPWMPKAMKIAVIMFSATSSVICAEVFTWLIAQGLDPRLFLQLLQTTGSRESAGRVEEFLKRGKSYGGALSNSYKDIRQALETAAMLHVPLPLMNTVNQLQEIARAQGLTRLNTPAAMGKLYEILTGRDLGEATLESERVFPEPGEPEVIYLTDLKD